MHYNKVGKYVKVDTDNREALLNILTSQAIHYGTKEQPILTKTGALGSRWVINLLGCSLQAEPLKLAAIELLKILKLFKGKQLATLGTAATPLLAALILESKGEYTGLMVRKKRKSYGTAKQVDGTIRPNEPVIIIDDSIGSGHTIMECKEILEQHGLYVEGCAVLLRFHYEHGYEHLLQSGLHVEFIYDFYKDFAPKIANEPLPAANPNKIFHHLQWSNQQLTEHLSPLQLARTCLHYYLQHGTLPQPPKKLSIPLDTQGGIWLSLREQHGTLATIARGGFHHLPEETPYDTPQAIALAASLAAQYLPKGEKGIEILENSAIAITAIGKLKPSHLNALEDRQKGLFVRSTDRPWIFGSALPNMPGIRNSAHQLEHCIQHNARLTPNEPYEVYQFDLSKVIEAGAQWPPGGIPTASETQWATQEHLVQPYLDTAWQTLENTIQQKSDTIKPNLPICYFNNIHAVFISLYSHGQLISCIGSYQLESDQWVVQLTKQAIQAVDSSYQLDNTDELSLKMSFITDSHYLGNIDIKSHIPAFSVGHDALHIRQGDKEAFMLPEVAMNFLHTEQDFVKMLLVKAGINSGKIQYTRFNCTTWSMNKHIKPQPLCGLLPYHATTNKIEQNNTEFLQLWFNYLVHQVSKDGYIRSRYWPYFHKHADSNKSIPYTIRSLCMMHKAQSLPIKNIDILFNIDEILMEVSELPTEERIEGTAILIQFINELIITEPKAEQKQSQYIPYLMACYTLQKIVTPHGQIYLSTSKQYTQPQQLHPTTFEALHALAILHQYSTQGDKQIIEPTALLQHHQHCAYYNYLSPEDTAALLRALCAWDRVYKSKALTKTLWMLAERLVKMRVQHGFVNDRNSRTPEVDLSATIISALYEAYERAKYHNYLQESENYLCAIRHGLAFIKQHTILPNIGYLFPHDSDIFGGILSSARRNEICIDTVLHALHTELRLYPQGKQIARD